MTFMTDDRFSGRPFSPGATPAQPTLSIPSPDSGRPVFTRGASGEPSLSIPPIETSPPRTIMTSAPKIPLFGAKLSIDYAIGASVWLTSMFSSGIGHAALVGVIIWTSFPSEDLQYGASRFRTTAISVSVVVTQVEEAAEDTGHEQQAAEALVAMAAPPPPPEPEKPKELDEPKPKDADALIEKKEEEKKKQLTPPPTAQAAQVSGQGAAQANRGRVSASYGEERAYGAIVRARIARRKPANVAHRGVTVVAFTIGATGDIVRCRVSTSSGDRDADDASMNAVHESAPFPPPPPEMVPVTYAIPFNYF
jgi:periplasmic protein TonB